MNESQNTSRLYRALSEINQAIVRMDEEALLFPLICRIAVEHGGMALAWVGRPAGDEPDITVIADYGQNEYLRGLKISASPDVPEGNGPSGTCWREKRTIITNDMEKNPYFTPWLARASTHGLRASAVMPITRGGEVYAVFTVYSSERDAFGDSIVALLDEVAGDVSFALDNFDRRAEIELSRQALAAKEKHFRAYFENSLVGMTAIDLNGNWIEMNQQFLDIIGYAREEINHLAWVDYTFPEDREEDLRNFAQLISGEKRTVTRVKRYLHKSGSVVFTHITAGAVLDDDGQVSYLVTTVEDITSEMLARQDNELLGEILDNSLNEIYIIDAESLKFKWASLGSCRNLGYSREEMATLTPVDIKPDFTWDEFRLLLDPLLAGEKASIQFETVHCRKNGTLYPVEVHLQYSGTILSKVFVAVILDLTERKITDHRLAIAAQIFDQNRDGIILADTDLKITAINEAFANMTGFNETDYVGSDIRDLGILLGHEPVSPEQRRALAEHHFYEEEIWSSRSDGTRFVNRHRVMEMHDSFGRLVGYGGVFRDVTEETFEHASLLGVQRLNQLTGLMNRIALTEGMSDLLSSKASEALDVSLILINLNDFKNVNHSRGYRSGDMVLKEVARRLQSLEHDDVIVGHLGSDEFAIVVVPGDHSRCVAMSERLLALIAEPIEIEFGEVQITASIALATVPNREGGIEHVLRLAEGGLGPSLRRERNKLHVLDPARQIGNLRHLRLKNDLLDALTHNQLKMHYQPIIALLDGSIVGFEALVRWTHPELGAVNAHEIIEVTTELGSMAALGNWVIENVIAQVADWKLKGIQIGKAAINVSAHQFFKGDLVETLDGFLAKYKVPASCIDLEITEDQAMDPTHDVMTQFIRLRKRGVGISIDDFGTGYSSLSYLKSFPLSTLKLDRLFVSDLTDDPVTRTIVKGIIDIAEALGFDTVAEGVETPEQLELLISLGCKNVQGYLFSKAVAPDAIPTLIEDLGNSPLFRTYWP